MKILAIGDLHIQRERLNDADTFLQQLSKFLKSHPVDIIVIMGDTLHNHADVYTPCFNKMLKYIQLCESHAETYVLIGNHDWCSNTEFLNDNHPFLGWKSEHNIIDRVVNFDEIVLIPYVPDRRMIEALDTSPGWRNAHLIFGHQLLNGVKMGPVITKGVEEWKEEYPMLISGHIHDKQRPQKNLYYTGSAMQVSFGEQIDHTVAIITLDNGKIGIEEIDINPPRKKTIYTDMKSLPDLVIEEKENLKIKLSISGDAEEFKTFKKSLRFQELEKKGVKIVFKQKKTVKMNLPTTTLRNFPDILFELCQEDGMRDLFYETMGGKVELIFED